MRNIINKELFDLQKYINNLKKATEAILYSLGHMTSLGNNS